MSAASPDQVYEVLVREFNAGSLERLIELYESDAVLVAGPGENMAGTEQVRAALEGFLGLKGTMSLDVVEVIRTDDVALGSVRWSVEGKGPDGQSITLGGVSADILRQQPAGDWRYVIDQPWGDQMTKPA